MTVFSYALTGRRVKLLFTDDPFTNLRVNDMGTIQYTLEHQLMESQLVIDWDNGSKLMLLEGVDMYEIQ